MNIEQFRVKEGEKLDLDNRQTDFTGNYTDKHAAKKDLKSNIKQLRELQRMLYAHDRYALLIIFQAMDAAGKDGAIRHVMSGLNPQGTQVFSFKKPSSEERDHDYMWRCMKALPERGRIGIFNRSYYEDVLIVRVHNFILQGKQLPNEIKNDPNLWQQRFEQIRNFEKYLTENGIQVVKFFLHVSKEEQRQRFLARIDTPEKNWKLSPGDVKERGYWDEYMNAYTDAIQNTSTENAPWYVIPADHKWFSRVTVSNVLINKMQSLDMKYPELDEEQMRRLVEIKEMLENED